MNDIDKAE